MPSVSNAIALQLRCYSAAARRRNVRTFRFVPGETVVRETGAVPLPRGLGTCPAGAGHHAVQLQTGTRDDWCLQPKVPATAPGWRASAHRGRQEARPATRRSSSTHAEA